jgi:hypothetical protein
MPRVVMCADDFGLTEGVCHGILDLVHMGRVSATGVMANMPWWPRFAAELRELDGVVGVGLHLNLTQGRPLGRMPGLAPSGVFRGHGELMLRAHLGSIPEDELAGEIGRQLDAFEDGFGRAPDFVDGHQHVHVLPVVRRVLLAALRRRRYGRDLWLRDPSDSWGAIVRRGMSGSKAAVVRGTALGFARAARRAGFDVNEGFSGFSPFDPKAEAERVFVRAFLRLGRRPVVMCHPGYVDDELERTDAVVGSRSRELMFLSSERFLDLLEVLGVTLATRPSEDARAPSTPGRGATI